MQWTDFVTVKKCRNWSKLLDECILNVITHITNISNARRFEGIQGGLWSTKKGGLPIHIYKLHVHTH